MVGLEGDYGHMLCSISSFKIQNDGWQPVGIWSALVSCEEQKYF